MEWWHKVERWGSEHPVMLGIGIFVIGAVLLYLFVGGSKAAPAPVQQDLTGSYLTAQAQATQAGNNNAAAQAYLQAQTTVSKDQLTASQGHDAAQVTVADLAKQTYLGIAGIQASTDQLAIGTQGQVDMLGSTLAARTAQAGYDADVQKAIIGSTTTLGQANYDFLTAQALYQNQTQQTGILANRDISGQAYNYYGRRDEANYAAQTAEALYQAQTNQAGIYANRDISGQAYNYYTARDEASYDYQTAATRAYFADQSAKAGYAADTAGYYFADQTAQAGYAADTAGYYYADQTARAQYTAETASANADAAASRATAARVAADASTAAAAQQAATQQASITASQNVNLAQIQADTYLASQALAEYPNLSGTGLQLLSPSNRLTSISRA